MSKNLCIKSILSTALLFILSACSQSGAMPDIHEPETKPAPNAAAPAVGDQLAKEAGESRIIYHIGPVDLPAGTDIKVALEKPMSMRFQTDKAIWVTGFLPKVVDANGGELPSKLLHHAIIYNLHDENPLCSGAPNPFVVATSMLTEVNLPQGYGYPILPTDPLEANVVLSNPTDKNYSDVFFEITLVARAMNEFTSRKDVKPMLLELDPCGHAPIDAPPNAFTEKKATYQVPETSSLVLAQSVIQDYGAAVQLISSKDIMPFWRSEAILDDAHHITGMTANPFEDSGGIDFKSGQQITFSASYNNSSTIWLDGASAAAMIYLAPKD